jgi:hypothetical protein
MRSVAPAHGVASVRLSRALPRVATLLVILVAVGLLTVAPARAATWTSNTSYAWGNGTVNCLFNATAPAVAASATQRNGTGMSLALERIDERNSSGAPVATAVMGAVPWDPVNTSTGQWFVMNYTRALPVTNPSVPSQQYGTVNLTLDFSLIRNLSDPTARQVTVALAIDGWPWQSSQDRLALVVPIWSTFPGAEHIVTGSSTDSTVASVSTASGQTLESFTAGVSATANAGGNIPVSAQSTLAGGVATVTLTLGAGVGGATSIAYGATLSILPSAAVLGLPLYDYAAVAGGAGLVALFVGVGTGRLRRRPSDLIYVEESE